MSGALLAGVLLGVVDTVSAYYIGSYVTTIVLLGAAALTIVCVRSGLLGRSDTMTDCGSADAPARRQNRRGIRRVALLRVHADPRHRCAARVAAAALLRLGDR